MKKLLTLGFSLVALFALIGCEGEVTLDTPDVDYVVEDEGATLALSWDEITDATGYIIYADGVVVDTVELTSFDATTPAALYEVVAYAGEDVSDPGEVDCAPVVTTSITVYGNSDPEIDHPSGLGFNLSGTAVPLALSDSANWPSLDYYFDDATYAGLYLFSPSDHSPAYNGEINAAIEHGADFDAVTIADAPGSGYSTQCALGSGGVYALWVDPDGNNWSDSDNFGKMQVESISGTTAPYTAVITTAYQMIHGLRWVVTD